MVSFQAVWEQTKAAAFAVSVTAVLLGFKIYLMKRKIDKRTRKKNRWPPAQNSAWPFLGDSVSYWFSNPVVYVTSRFLRYGSVYQTSSMCFDGYTLMDGQTATQVLRNSANKVEYLNNMPSLLGDAVSYVNTAEQHNLLRRMLSLCLTPGAIQAGLPELSLLVARHVSGLAASSTCSARLWTEQLAVELLLTTLTGSLPEEQLDHLTKECLLLCGGMHGWPVRIPYLGFDRALKAQKKLQTLLWKLIQRTVDCTTREVQRLLEQGDTTGPSAPPQDARQLQIPDALGQARRKMQLIASTSMCQSYVTSWGQKPLERDCVIRELSQAVLSREKATLTYCIGVTCWVYARLPFQPEGLDPETAVNLLLQPLCHSVPACSSALFSVVVILGLLPAIRHKVWAEQQEVKTHHGDDLSMPALDSMVYLGAVIKECLRILPPTQGMVRRLASDVLVDHDAARRQYVIPKDSLVWIPPGGVHAIDPSVWDGDRSRPLPAHMDVVHGLQSAFKPERWLDPSSRPQHDMSFGAGPHGCLGATLFTTQCKLLISRLIQVYDWEMKDSGMFAKCRWSPRLMPAKGTDSIRLIPRHQGSHG